MPLDIERASDPPLDRVGASAVIELACLICTCSNHKPPRVEIPPRLADRIAGFWRDGFGDLGEVVVLAHAVGALADMDVEDLLERLRDPEPFDTHPPLESEVPAERDAIHARLDRFMADRRLRGRYVALLRDLWDVYAPTWAAEGRAQAEAAAAAWSARLASGTDVLDLLPERHVGRRDDFPAMVRRAERNGELRLTPTVAGHGHIVALPGLLSLAAPPAEPDPAVARRRSADEIAELLRVLSDPTRLTILAQLAQEPLGVSELARTLHIAQPTASVHLRRLKDAGLVTAERQGARSVYTARPAAVEGLMTDVTGRLARTMGG